MTTVGEVMGADLIAVEPTDQVATAAAIMTAGRVGSALVMEGDDLVGIFTERDILRALARDPRAGQDSAVSRWMSPNPMTIDPSTSVVDALDRMLSGGFRHLPIVEDRTVVGVISIRDLARSLRRDLSHP
jgi:CBS domain-containing protein